MSFFHCHQNILLFHLLQNAFDGIFYLRNCAKGHQHPKRIIPRLHPILILHPIDTIPLHHFIIGKIKSELEKNFINSDLSNLEKLIEKEKTKYFESKPSLATRQCSMAAIESVSTVLPQLIGGSADLSGSNNTKTNNSKIINSKNFNGLVFMYSNHFISLE
mgnify:CR=1 FL=1